MSHAATLAVAEVGGAVAVVLPEEVVAVAVGHAHPSMVIRHPMLSPQLPLPKPSQYRSRTSRSRLSISQSRMRYRKSMGQHQLQCGTLSLRSLNQLLLNHSLRFLHHGVLALAGTACRRRNPSLLYLPPNSRRPLSFHGPKLQSACQLLLNPTFNS